MTIIAWDGKTLAADKLSSSAGLSRTVTKIYRLTDGSLFGYSGHFSIGMLMKCWLEGGRANDKFPTEQKDKDDWGTCVVVDASGVKIYERTCSPIHFEDRQHAFGSGRDFALAAMHLGKTAKEAVEIACLFETGCGMGVDELKL